jgi:hypothetical protein
VSGRVASMPIVVMAPARAESSATSTIFRKLGSSAMR